MKDLGRLSREELVSHIKEQDVIIKDLKKLLFYELEKDFGIKDDGAKFDIDIIATSKPGFKKKVNKDD